MPRPENVLIGTFFLINAFFSLLPALLILIRRYFKDVFTLLMILCLLNFVENIVLLIIPQSQVSDQTSIQNIFSVVELILLIQMSTFALSGRARDLLNVFSIVFLTAIVTFYFSKGAGEKRMGIESIMQVIVVVVVGGIFIYFVERHGLQIFNYPLFWVAVGTLFYYSIALLVNIIDTVRAAENDRAIVLNIASLVRYVFYALAIIFYKQEDKHEDRSSKE